MISLNSMDLLISVNKEISEKMKKEYEKYESLDDASRRSRMAKSKSAGIIFGLQEASAILCDKVAELTSIKEKTTKEDNDIQG